MRLTLFLAAMLTLGGCGPFRRAKAPPPPPGPIPARIPDQLSSVEAATGTTSLPPPPAIATSVGDHKPETETVGLPARPPAAPPRPAQRARRTRPVAPVPVPVQTEATPEEPMPAAPTYRLGELRKPEEVEQLRQQTEQLLERCAAALAVAEGKRLTPMQTEMVNRVRLFTAQAREALERDAGEARSFAAKGRTFADALLAELK